MEEERDVLFCQRLAEWFSAGLWICNLGHYNEALRAFEEWDLTYFQNRRSLMACFEGMVDRFDWRRFVNEHAVDEFVLRVWYA